MKHKLIVFSVILAVIVGVGFVFASAKKDTSSPTEPASSSTTQVESTQTQTSQTESNSSDGQSFSESEVAQHKSSSDCWLIVDGGVYDVTDFIGTHPGGSAIIRYCGRDATSAFQGRSDHSSGQTDANGKTATEELARLKIGTLQ